MIKFNLKHIEAFVTVADLGTFRRAADRLHTTQPNISNRLAQLEAMIGARLMERDAGSVRLTPRGHALLPHAREILAATDRFVAATGDTSHFSGVMRLGVTELVAHTWLRAFLMAMRAEFPAIDVELTIDLSADLSKALFAHEIDLALQSGPFEQAARHSLRLGQSAYVWVAAPQLALPDQPLRIGDLAGHAILAHSRGTAPYRQLEDHFAELGQRMRLVSASNIGTCLQIALDGLGIACLPEAMLAEALADGRLRRLDYPWRPADLQFAARSVLNPLPTYVAQAARLAQDLYPPP